VLIQIGAVFSLCNLVVEGMEITRTNESKARAFHQVNQRMNVSKLDEFHQHQIEKFGGHWQPPCLASDKVIAMIPASVWKVASL
jgi:hypothetical protein